MEEKDFLLLQALKETQSITRTADKLFMTQSAVSKRIHTMEEELGVELLLRSRQGVRFTPEGELVLAHCSAASDRLATMRRTLDAIRGNLGGTVRAAVCMSYAQYCLPDVLNAYCIQHPHVQMNVSTGYSTQLYYRLSEGAVDVAVLRGEYPWMGEQFLLRQENYLLVYHRKYQGVPLKDYPYIDRTEAPGDVRSLSWKRRWLREQGLDPRRMCCAADSVALVMELVKQGLGWSIVPDVGVCDPDVVMETCRYRDGSAFGRGTYALCARESLELPQVRAFVDLLRQNSCGSIE